MLRFPSALSASLREMVLSSCSIPAMALAFMAIALASSCVLCVSGGERLLAPEQNGFALEQPDGGGDEDRTAGNVCDEGVNDVRRDQISNDDPLQGVEGVGHRDQIADPLKGNAAGHRHHPDQHDHHVDRKEVGARFLLAPRVRPHDDHQRC